MLRQPFKWLPYFLIVLLLFLQYRLWFDESGVLNTLALKNKLNLQLEKNLQFKKRNEELLQQIQSLEGNDEALEARARTDLGMIKKGETFYQVVD